MTTIASWLVMLEPGRSAGVRSMLETSPGIECRSEARGTLIVLSESPPQAGGLDEVLQLLRAVPGVRDASLVKSYDEA